MNPTFRLAFLLILQCGMGVAQESTYLTTDCYQHRQAPGTVNGKPDKPGTDLLCADIPDDLANQIEKATGISAKKDGICILAHKLDDGRWITNVKGTGVAAKGAGDIPSLGVKPWKHDFYVRYTSLVESIENERIYTYGYFEYHDKHNEKQCFVICEVEGKVVRNAENKDEMSGKSRWIGPLKTVKFPFIKAKSDSDEK